MLELKTSFGTFGNFKDMSRYMEEENIREVMVEAHYVFTKIVKLVFTLKEIKEKIASGELA
ncbi:hypothetical protein C818_04190 [Lachnospiraceae bacterium MD308]|nr:hypothetical protein C818_04190 [Lachnospiraceae bacterium MD308]